MPMDNDHQDAVNKFKKLFPGNSSECQTLTEEGLTYFDQLVAEYKLLCRPVILQTADAPPSCEAQLWKLTESIVVAEKEKLTWGQLFQLEKAILKLQSDQVVRQRTWSLRAKFRDIAGEEGYELYTASKPPDPLTGDIGALRADMENLLGQFHWLYAFAPVRERMRNALGQRVFYVTLFLVSVAIFLAIYSYAPTVSQSETVLSNIPVLPVIMVLGMLGAFLSLQRRIQSVPSTGDPIVNISELTNNAFSVYIAPISGAVFATLLYIIFVAGLLKGPLFPAISTPDGRCQLELDSSQSDQSETKVVGSTDSSPSDSPSGASTSNPQQQKRDGAATTQAGIGNKKNSSSTKPAVPKDASTAAPQTEDKASTCLKTMSFQEFIQKTAPASGVQYAILLVWSFIAGFAERLVPDTIDRLVAQSSGQSSGSK